MHSRGGRSEGGECTGGDVGIRMHGEFNDSHVVRWG